MCANGAKRVDAEHVVRRALSLRQVRNFVNAGYEIQAFALSFSIGFLSEPRHADEAEEARRQAAAWSASRLRRAGMWYYVVFCVEWCRRLVKTVKGFERDQYPFSQRAPTSGQA